MKKCNIKRHLATALRLTNNDMELIHCDAAQIFTDNVISQELLLLM